MLGKQALIKNERFSQLPQSNVPKKLTPLIKHLEWILRPDIIWVKYSLIVLVGEGGEVKNTPTLFSIFSAYNLKITQFKVDWYAFLHVSLKKPNFFGAIIKKS